MPLITEWVPKPFDQGPPPQIAMTVGQYKTRTALHIDPLLGKYVVIVDPPFTPRSNNELDAWEVKKSMRNHRARTPTQ